MSTCSTQALCSGDHNDVKKPAPGQEGIYDLGRENSRVQSSKLIKAIMRSERQAEPPEPDLRAKCSGRFLNSAITWEMVDKFLFG